MLKPFTIARVAISLALLVACVAASATTAHACRPNPAVPVDGCAVIGAAEEAREDIDDLGPTNPYCNMYEPAPGRACVTVKKPYTFQAFDPEKKSTFTCTVTLEGSAPEDQTDPANRPDVQYRTSIGCGEQLQVITIRPALYTATGTYLASAPEFHCHILGTPCPLSASTGGRGLREGPADYRQTTYVRMVLKGGPDPWLAAEGRPGNPDHPESCLPNYEQGYVLECLLDLDIPATPPQSR